MGKSLGSISPEMKVEYMEALRVCPEVVETESAPLLFLRRENFNYWAAALRLVSYWKLRKEAFGADAFLPLQLKLSPASGTRSCFDVSQVPTLEVLSVLPPDERGRSVVCFDASRLNDIALDMDALRRLCFCFGNIVAKNHRSQSEGIVFLGLFSRKLPAISYAYRCLLDIIVQALPVKLRRIVLVQKSPESLSRDEFLDEVLPNVLGFMGSSLEMLSVPVSGHTLSDVQDGLKSLGLQSKTISAFMSKGSNPLKAAAMNEDPDESGVRHDSVTHTYESKKPVAVDEDQDNGVEERGLRLDCSATDTSAAAHVPRKLSLDCASLSQEPNDEESRALDKMEEALRSIPELEKVAYLEALQAAPHLIRLESPPLRFLRFERLNPLGAARRLVAYWTTRKASFAERFCLPLSVADGPSALNDFEKRLLGVGGFVSLSRDQKGRAVILNNSGRGEFVAGEHDRTERSPILFYTVQLASEMAAEVVVVTIISPRGVSPRNVQFLLQLLQHAAPLRIVQSNVCIICPKSGWRSYMEATIPRLMQGLPKYVLRSLTIHIASTRRDMLGRLEAAGFLDCKLPDCLGGKWTYENDYRTWLQERAQLDATRYSHRPTCAIVVDETANLIQRALDAGKQPEELGFLGLDSSRGSCKIAAPFELTPRDLKTRDVKKLAASEIARAASPPPMLHTTSFDAPTAISDSVVPKQGTIAPIHSWYKKALVAAPHLVASETPESTFVRYAGDRDHAFATELMESYWIMRGSLFGDRAFLTMSQTGEGTLTQGDCKLLSEGFIVLLQSDTAQRPVICIDPSKMPSYDSQTASLQRVIFYMGTVLAENSVTQTDGCVVLLCLTECCTSPIRLLDETFRVLLTSLPIHFHSVHIIGTHHCCNQNVFNSLVHEVTSVLGSYTAVRTFTHYCDSEASLAHRLERHGLVSSSLPECMGGNWAYSRLADWIDARIRYEWGLPWRKELDHGAAPIPNYKVTPLSDCSEEEKQERTRRLHMLHSRRRRGRMKVEVDVLEAQVDDIIQSNKRLRDENQVLEVRIAAAKQFLGSYGLQ
jgi:hypothetical protein